MIVAFFVFLIIILMFSFVLLFGAPYLPTMKKQSETALDLLNLRSGQTMLELGCGDGRVLKQAARRGYKAVGYELNLLLVIIAWLNTFRYRKQVKVIWGNFWTKKWPQADGIFVFLLNKYMKKLDSKIVQDTKKPIRLVSFAFKIPGKKIDKTQDGLYLYIYK